MMKKDEHYRSPIDKLVVESGIKATAVAKEMGINYNRMVAIRRAKKVAYEDVMACKAAIDRIHNGRLNKPETPTEVQAVQNLNKTLSKILETVKKIEAKIS